MLLLAVAVVWGSTYLAAKNVVTPRTVIAILAIRFTLTAVAMAPLCAARLRKATRAEVLTGALFGTILAAILALETFGIAHTSATNAGLIISLTMVMTPMLDSVVTRSWLPGQFFAAAVVAVVGVALLASGSGLRAPSAGDLLVLAAAGVRAVHVTMMHRLSAHRAFDSLTLTFVQMSTAAAAFLLLSPLCGTPLFATAARLDASDWGDICYLALVGTVFAFLVQMWAVRSTSPSRVSLLLGTEPIWALAVGVLIGGDRLGTAGAAGALLVLVGAGWGQRVERRHRISDTDAPVKVIAEVG